MSTFLVSLGVVAAAICVLRIALSDPDQPATLARRTDRAGRRPQPSPAPAPAPSTQGAATPSAGGAAVASTASPPVALALRARARSAMALMILVTFTGVVLAALVGTGLALLVRAFTRAVQ